MPPYSVSSLPAAFTFGNEQRFSVPTGSFILLSLPFSFPFFDQKYGTGLVYSNGRIAFDYTAQFSACTDFVALQPYKRIAPLWTSMSVTGTIAVARPDVCAGLKDADACPNIGFTTTFNTRVLLNGPHVLGIRAVNDRGDSVTFPALDNGGINVFVEN